jgi:hypothetical protein
VAAALAGPQYVGNAQESAPSLRTGGSGTVFLDASQGSPIVHNLSIEVAEGTTVTTMPQHLNTLTIRNGAKMMAASSGTNTIDVELLQLELTSVLDLKNNKMIIDYMGPSPFATIANQIKTAYAGGSWNGDGTTSSSAAAASSSAHRTALGFAEASALFTSFPAIFSGQTVDNTAVLVHYVYSGDADLSGTVDSIDFNLLASNFAKTGKSWDNGDFNFDGSVDTIDFTLLVSNFSLALPANEGGSVPSSAVPEPSCIGWLAAALLMRPGRRRVI